MKPPMTPEQRIQFGLSPRPTRQQREDLLFLHLLLDRQVAGIADCLRHICYRNQWTGYIAHIETELADLTTLVRRFADILELDHDEIVKLGTRRDADKKDEWLNRHPGGSWI